MQAPHALPDELTIFTASEWLPQCQAWLQAPAGEAEVCEVLAVDAQAVVEIDAAGLQLLVSLNNSLENAGRRLDLLSPSPVLSDACRALGASRLLCRPDTKEPA
jgi:anti-anti-sigma regulatory factor